MNILIVEDELIAAENISRNLNQFGYTVTGKVQSGEKAIENITENPPDLVLMDIKLKGKLNGIETADKINKMFPIPIVYITAYSDSITIKKATKTTPYGYLIKPFKAVDIKTTIEMALAKHQTEQQTIKTLSEALSQAQEINQLKSQFFSTVSHDLRTPLTTILASLELLRNYSEHFSAEQKEKLFSRIKTAGKNMTELLEDLLLVNQAELGKLRCELVKVDIVTFCQDLLESLQLILSSQHQLNFVCLVDGKPQTNCSDDIYLDKKLLRHILTNLLSNAIKYSPDGGPITLELNCQPKQIIFRVKDQGIGIPPEYQEKLFKVFERARNTINIKGTGLGLYIVKQAVDVHQGAIAVESEMGVGSTFTVTLPSLAPTNRYFNY
ncbi:MAG: ATP-binding protein [Microcoleaceae cyanobacterium]